MGLVRSAARVHYDNPIWFALGNGQIGVAHSTKEGAVLLLKTVFVGNLKFTFRLIAGAGAFNAGGNVIIHKDCEVRFQITAQNSMQPERGLAAQFSSASLMGFAV